MARDHWELIAAAGAMAVLLTLGGLFISQELKAPAPVTRHTLATVARGDSNRAVAPSSSPIAGAAATPSTIPTAAHTPSSGSALAGASSAPSPAAGVQPPPASAGYPRPAPGSGAYTTKFLASDLSLPEGFSEQFTETAAGVATLHAFWASSGTGYPALKGCLQASSQPACSPASLPYDSTGHVQWPVGNGAYLLRIAAYGSSQLIGFSLAWSGSHSDVLMGIRIARSCTSYAAGCGLRFEFTSSGAGTCGASTSAALHLRVQQKDSSAQPIYDGPAPASFAVPTAATWTGQLFSTTTSYSAISMSITWP